MVMEHIWPSSVRRIGRASARLLGDYALVLPGADTRELWLCAEELAEIEAPPRWRAGGGGEGNRNGEVGHG
ncbi:hypothetical protein ACTD5D_40095 [Nocardia takedensis]|uniref:hypothetical protein n=1 Tax=Nocardia takedensis TaxID=259390 RepID=UPI003F76026C